MDKLAIIAVLWWAWLYVDRILVGLNAVPNTRWYRLLHALATLATFAIIVGLLSQAL